MSVVNPDNKKMILTCDGGGIRGLIVTRSLEKLEEIEGDKPCNEIFDFMGGTSTGAVIVAGLAVGMRAAELTRFYREECPHVFQPMSFCERLRHKFGWKYKKTYLRRRLKEQLGDIRLEDLPVDIMITAKDTVRGETIFFEKKTFGKMLLRDAVESSISAPVYFRPNGRYIDGGVGSFNNVCYQAAVEALYYNADRYPAGQVQLLSFGTGRGLNNMLEGEAARKSILDWAFYVIGEGMDDANDQQVYITRKEYADQGKLEFRRYQITFTSEILARIGVKIPEGIELRNIGMDAVEHIDFLDEVGCRFAEYIDFAAPRGRDLRERISLTFDPTYFERLWSQGA